MGWGIINKSNWLLVVHFFKVKLVKHALSIECVVYREELYFNKKLNYFLNSNLHFNLPLESQIVVHSNAIRHDSKKSEKTYCAIEWHRV